MKKVELTRKEVVALYNGMSAYVETEGKSSNGLGWMCDNIMTYEPNEEVIEGHTKLLAKMEKELNRLVRKLGNKYAKLHTEGDKKGTFVLDEKGGFLYTPEAQDKLNEETDVVYDKYEDDINTLMKEKIGYYIDEASSVPDKLDIKFRNALVLLIPKEVLV